ncbi:3-ketoacyl-CoA thiolase [Candidatus Kryptonium thompsonii]|uniref:acetyl-CoA C-acyltransferase n=1 Tax=Candidatus Kryptonium thompsonii TaxID=1633631 RepID=A0A0P1MC72_9BACT|nr:acetyl-CoA C-acyltransferase [Candidatus Kryptonium thompsoni]CUS80656.1 3-ketoacyl-CoA thiolase [Candidatus Kryptonium thompsoni]CUS83515.1 3-ketoacyl-CoA thiolase [Candidatus Kryptonium thompsoni]CUS85282.1 3-ketoacyl-CoA thiolase [Candidatus Kryptonium thompsoni]CUS92623.1 3-ketoacyl-CoA thiolase [Candidatus Kryptonium thompsoni]CUS95200.1 3-ketoacyl-CoA thiolase [Candidatus Kryptonium thompsoni]
MQDAVIVTAVRTAVGRAKKGTLKDFRPDEMLATVISEAVKRTPNLKPDEIDDVIIGCAFPEGEQGLNVARIASLRAGLPVSVPAMTINRFCSSGLQSIAFAAERIKLGYADIIIAGGVESMSMVPMTGNKFSANPYLAENYPEVYISMGLTAERVAEKYQITREMQDEFALKSHQKALKAIQEGKFKDEIVPLKVVSKYINGKGEKVVEEKIFDTDEGPRPDTSLEKLAQLKPAFKEGGTVTAGNSSQMSDGAAVVVVMSEKKANELGLKPIARFVSYAVAGVAPEIMGIGPVEAIPKALKLAGLKLDDIGLIELNEAFAAQSLAVIKLAGLNEEIVNVNGGAIALGHPLGCTGTKLTVTILNEMKRRNVKYGMVTMCVGGGMGAAGIFELI